MKRGFEYALKNNGLIYGVLAQLNYKVGHPNFEDMFEEARILGSLSKRTDAKILIIIFKLLDESLIVFCFK
ncbi:hypothetical protein ACTQXV_10020 [Ligilactobacillus salivarius]|uniref:hypothetical protein n=1 Tax=Ligilactobacillus salivarius TaxID=1624 RepID=UPI001CDD3A2A|nr:hypothetical protein [Ligilactobacillus salivarius]